MTEPTDDDSGGFPAFVADFALATFDAAVFVVFVAFVVGAVVWTVAHSR